MQRSDLSSSLANCRRAITLTLTASESVMSKMKSTAPRQDWAFALLVLGGVLTLITHFVLELIEELGR